MKRTGPPPRRRAMRKARRRLNAKERALSRLFKLKVFELCRGRCIVTGLRLSYVDHAHHVVEKERLRRDGHPPEVVYDPALGVGVKVRVHERHTLAVERIPYEKLPQRCIDRAEALGYGWVIDRFYPRTEEV